MTKGKPRKENTEPTETPAAPDGAAAATDAACAAPAAEPTAAPPQTPAAAGGAPPTPPPPDERWLRLQADFDNFRKRVQRERQELHRQATENLMKELLPVLDHLDLALDAAVQHQAGAAVIQGVKLVAEQLQSALAKFGLTPIEAAGQPFDPQRHEAISHLPSAETPAEHVLTQVRRGYLLGSRLLRPAQVVVSSGAPPAPAAPPASGAEAAEG